MGRKSPFSGRKFVLAGWHGNRLMLFVCCGCSANKGQKVEGDHKYMKRTLSILSAAIFASAIAIPAFAQSGSAAPAASAAAPEASAAASPSTEKPAPKHHHKKKSEMSGDTTSMASPAASPAADSTTK
jgi:cytoskeletal protein RodZ